jgi:alcohol dehydrogenase (cytochrome c)
MTGRTRFSLVLGCLLALASLHLHSQAPHVTSERLTRAVREPQNWLTYSGTYMSQRYSTLNQINLSNVKTLEQKWAYQGAVVGPWQTTPLVVDGVMYLTQRPNDVVALDAKTGRVFWIYQHVPAADHRACCGSNNRGLAILGDTLFLATLDARLVALDARTGRRVWDTAVADYKLQYSMTVAPLVVKDKVIIGVGGGDLGIRGFIAAYDARTGKEAWRFYTVAGPGDPGHETWEPCAPSSSTSPDSPTYCDREAWKHGGGSVWLTGSYDPDLNLTYWGTGNVWPDFSPKQRPGDNLYTESVVALDADTGKLRWHFQFTPNGAYDYDAVQIPVLADLTLSGFPAKVMLWANRNGFFYVLDRATGRFLLGRPFVKVNWASDLNEAGRPIQTPQPPGSPTFPSLLGATNWYSPSYSPRTELVYVSAWENNGTIYGEQTPTPYVEGRSTLGGSIRPYVPVKDARAMPLFGRGPINNWTEATGHGAVKAIDPRTGKEMWKFYMTDVSASGILTTASDLLFTGGREGYFLVLDARKGALLWKANLGAPLVSGPITYEVEGKQYVAAIAGLSLVTFGLRE